MGVIVRSYLADKTGAGLVTGFRYHSCFVKDVEDVYNYVALSYS
jgi:hypothetical protein